jgi:protocatechuate 3,4-dioxygenase beta subunit
MLDRERPPADPPLWFPDYRSTRKRAPLEPPVRIPQTPSDAGARADWRPIAAHSIADLTRQHAAPPIGERIIVTGRILDGEGAPLGDALVEIWQANAAGRYAHREDRHDAPLDPNFSGVGRVLTDDAGRYRFCTITPGAYPWGNHANAWRPRHIHFSILGPTIAARLVTQMYFPGDPLIATDPIAQSVPKGALDRLVARLDLGVTEEGVALGYVFDVVLGGRGETPAEP